MCGIAGILAADATGVSDDTLRAMGAAMAHRGPDNLGTFREGAFGAAHTRLSIVDTSAAGNQPFVDDEWVLIYNGEIYNHGILRAELAGQGARFRGTSDTSSLFEAIRHWGIERTLRAIHGMFAFAAWDRKARRLYLARDRVGIKPLHYAQHAGGLVFASEVKAMAPAMPLRVDPVRSLFAVASVADDSLDRSAFAGVRQVLPGHFLTIEEGRAPELHQYHRFTDDIDEGLYRELDRASGAEVVERFTTLFDRSVKGMLMSDAPMGVFVSGGIDSSVIAASAVRQGGALPLFTADVVGPLSEVEDARALAKTLGCRLERAEFKREDFFAEWARATWHYECPIVRHVNALPFLRVAGLARSCSVKAVLTGEGSDELFLGYPKLLTRRFNKAAAAPVEALKSVYGLVPGLREYLWPSASDDTGSFLGLVAQDFQRQRLRREGLERLEFLGKEAALEQYLTLQMLQEGLHSLLHRNDRMGMSRSIEARFPFLDEEVMRFGVSLPSKYKIGRSARLHNYKHPFLVDKWIVRRMAERSLPERLAHKVKNGFPVSGLRDVRVDEGFFRGGFVEQEIGLSPGAQAHMVGHESPYQVAKLASVEVFGRLFAFGHGIERVEAHIREHARFAG